MNSYARPALALTALVLLTGTPAIGQVWPGPNNQVGTFDPSANVPRLGGPVPMLDIPFNSNRLIGLPVSWATEQYRLYGRSVLALNRVLERGAAAADRALAVQLFNRQALHYGFLTSLGGSGPPAQPRLLSLMQAQGLDWAAWQAQVLALAAYLESGWIVWEYNFYSGSTSLYPARDETDVKLGSLPLVVLNLDPEAYRSLGADKAAYVSLLLSNLNWERIAGRLSSPL